VYQLESIEERPETRQTVREILDSLGETSHAETSPALSVLCRSMEQVEAATQAGVKTVYLDFEDIRRYREAVETIRERSADVAVFLATPRIQKAGEQGFFKLI